jgi:hypothetical protein
VFNGVVVSDNNPNVPYNSATQNNVITFNNGVQLKGTGNINMATVPAAEVAHVNALKGMFVDNAGAQVNSSMVLAPNFGLSFQGGMTTTAAVAMIGAQFNIANGSAISLNGVMMSLGSNAFTVAGGMTVTANNLPQQWPGTSSASLTSVSLNRGTYTEVPASAWMQ